MSEIRKLRAHLSRLPTWLLSNVVHAVWAELGPSTENRVSPRYNGRKTAGKKAGEVLGDVVEDWCAGRRA